jgi:hypothetical protein
LPADDLPLGSAFLAPTIKSSKPSPLTSPALETEYDLIVGAYSADPSGKSSAGKSYVIFGKQDNAAINLSAIASGTGGFVIKPYNHTMPRH